MKIVGINIKRLRSLKKLSLRDLAKRLKITPSFLSQIETGKSSPSLSTLKEISNELDTTIGFLLGEESPGESSPLMLSAAMKEGTLMSEGVRVTLLTSPNQNKQMEPLLFRLDKGADSGKSYYKHFGQEFILVLKGTLEIKLNDTPYVLSKGDSLYFNSSTPHQFKNIDKGDTEAVWVVTPPSF
ncbi:MAG: helix-turn-helix transcriptional regulator [Fibrobacteres bacterium]|nr:helix-turn-helix transcriptional regulator [Fibrobacterota bacterium]